MTMQQINLGALSNDGTGDTLRAGGQKINENFSELEENQIDLNGRIDTKQDYSALLASISLLTTAANQIIYLAGANQAAVTALSSAGRDLIGLSDNVAMRNALGLGSAALSNLAEPGGAASLGADGKIPSVQLPPITLSQVYTVSSQAEMLALPAIRGDIAVRADEGGKTYVLAQDDPAVLENWISLNQALSASLAALNTLVPAADQLPYFIGPTSAALTSITAFARAMLAGVDAPNVRATLGMNTPDVAYRRDNVLGVVSASGEVPTGAIIERGSSANGEYTKYADGTLICIGSVASLSAGTPSVKTWAAPFIDATYRVSCAPELGVTSILPITVKTTSKAPQSCGFVFTSSNAQGVPAYPGAGWNSDITAIGRWR